MSVPHVRSTVGAALLLPLLLLIAAPAVAGDVMASFTVSPGLGVVTVSKQWSIGASLAGFRTMSQDLNLGTPANSFYSVNASVIPSGGDATSGFKYYIASTGSSSAHADIGSKLTPDSYSGLASADPDVGFGSVNFYLIHHRGATDYFAVIVPSSGTASSVTDLKPMSAPGGPGTVTGVNGYVALTFASANLGYGLNMFYYLRTNSTTGVTSFGMLVPALAGTATDLISLGVGTYSALEFVGPDVGFGVNQMYYLRLDTVTGFTVFGTLDPSTGAIKDIANLGGVLVSLPYSPSDLGYGAGRFYTAGRFNPTSQSVSFAAIGTKSTSAGAFTVSPSASSALPITLTVVSGSVGTVSISGPASGVYTVTPTGPGVITLQATQLGATSPVAFESNMLRQSFTITSTQAPPTVSPAPGATIPPATPAPPTTTPPPGATTTPPPPTTTAAPPTTTAAPGTLAPGATTTAAPPPTTPAPTPAPVAMKRMATFSIFPGTGKLTVTPAWSVAATLAGLRPIARDLKLGGMINAFYSVNASAIPVGGDITAFGFYDPQIGTATAHADIGSKLTPDSYSGLTFADPDVGYGAGNFYLIHHRGTTCYFATIVPGAGNTSSVTDLKPMSGPGSAVTVTGVNGYVALTFSSANLGYGPNMFYYLRTNSAGITTFGSLSPALAGTATELFNLGVGTYSALEFIAPDVGFGANKMYYLRLDAVTGFTVAGFIDPMSGMRADIANLGSVFTTLSYFSPNLGFGINCFYTSGSINPTWQSVSFAAIANRSVSNGAFNVTPTASSALRLNLTVVASESTGTAVIVESLPGIFTVTPMSSGSLTLRAAQAGATLPFPFEANMLQHRFWVLPLVTRTLRINGNFTALLANATSAARLKAAVGADLTKVLNITVNVTEIRDGSLIVVFTTDTADNITNMADRVTFAGSNSTWLTDTQSAYTALGAPGRLAVTALVDTTTIAPTPAPTSGTAGTTVVTLLATFAALLLAIA